jgi:hypothetical protein
MMAFSRSQIIDSTFATPLVSCPAAKYFPSFDNAMHETSLLLPASRNARFFDFVDFRTIVDPRG